MAQAHRLPLDDRDVREMAHRAREERGLPPQQLAEAVGATVDDVEFIETHGIAVTAPMLAVLRFLDIEDYESEQMARLAYLIPGGRGDAILAQLVEGGFKQVEAIEAAAGDGLLGLPWFDLGQLSLLREGLRLYRAAEMTGDADAS